MVSVNVTAFAVLKILRNLVSVQKFLFVSMCWRKQNNKKYLIFIFTELSENVNSFVQISLVIEIKKKVNLRKTRLLAHARLYGNISRRRCKCRCFNVSLRFRIQKTVQCLLNGFYSKTRLWQGLFHNMELLKKYTTLDIKNANKD